MRSGLFVEVPSERSPEEVKEPATHMSPGRVVWEGDLLAIVKKIPGVGWYLVSSRKPVLLVWIMDKIWLDLI